MNEKTEEFSELKVDFCIFQHPQIVEYLCWIAKGISQAFWKWYFNLLKYLPSKLSIIKDRFGQLCVPFQSYKINERFTENHRWYWCLVKKKRTLNWLKEDWTYTHKKKNKNESEIDFITWNVLPSSGIFSIIQIFCYPLGRSIEIGVKNNFILARSVCVLATCVHLAKML